MSTGLFRSSSRAPIRSLFSAALIALAVTLPFTAADARMGGGGSFGSRGSRTFSMPSPTTTAPRVSPFNQSATPSPGFNNGFAGSRPGFFGGGFGRGLIGGFLGAGLFGLLFGNGFGGGLGGGASLIGLLLQLGLIYLAFRFIMNLIRQRQPAYGNGASMFGGGPQIFGGAPNTSGGRPPQPEGRPINIGPDDYQAFEQRLVESQQAYSNGDVGTLRRLATSEMAGNFQNELVNNDRQGVVNRISDVHLQQGDLSEAWQERGSDYVTVAMRFSLIDVTQEKGSGRVVAGNPSVPQIVTEVWTFVRPAGAPASAWTLSAIQQT